MVTEALTIRFPSELYNRLKRKATQSHRSVESEVLETIAAALPAEPELSAELTQAISQLSILHDADLIKMIKSQFSPKKSAQLEALHLKRQETELTPYETQLAAEIAEEMEEFMLLRAQAMSLLLQRGHDITSLLQ